MEQWKTDFWGTLLVPDNYPTDAYSWAANQAGHAALGVFAAVVLALAFAMINVATRAATDGEITLADRPSIAAGVTFSIGYPLFEVAQAAVSGSWLWADMAEDSAFAVGGAWVAVSLWRHAAAGLVVVAGLVALMARGIRSRK